MCNLHGPKLEPHEGTSAGGHPSTIEGIDMFVGAVLPTHLWISLGITTNTLVIYIANDL